MNISEKLRQIVRYERVSDEITVKSVADACEEHPRAVGYYLEGVRKPPLKFIQALSVWLIANYNDARLARWFMPDGVLVTKHDYALNGDTSDEILAITEHEGGIIRALRDGELGKAVELAEKIIHEAGKLRQEIEAKK